MENFNYETRKKLEETYRDNFYKKKKLQLLLFDSASKSLIEEIKQYASYHNNSKPLIEEAVNRMNSGAYKTPSEFMKKHYKKVVELYVPKSELANYYHIIDKYNQFQYTDNHNRRSTRSSSYGPHMKNVFRLLYEYYLFGIYVCSISQYLLNDMAEEKLDYKKNVFYNNRLERFDDMIAAGIDLGDQKLIQSIKDIILSENNTSVITTDIIRGIIKSSDRNLHKLLGEFLLAARLQEGVRQSICENADCGTTECFLQLFEVIYENDLIRFSSIKRAIATWVGICDENNMDRITNKVLHLMKTCLYDKKKSLELAESNDSIEIIIALWSLGFYEVNEAIEVMKQYVLHGTKNQRLTMSYYNLALDYKAFSEITAKKMIEEYRTDYEMAAAFMPTYLSVVDHYINQVIDRETETEPYKRIPVTYLFDGVEEAFKHFNILKELYEGMPKKKLDFSPCIFPWYGVYLSKTQLIKRLCLIAYSVGDSALIDYAASQLPSIDPSEGYSNRSNYMELLLHDPKNDYQRDLLITYLADKETGTRRKAFKMVENRRLEDKHYLQLEEMLKYKSNDIRENVIKLLLKQKGNAIVASVARLLAENKEEVRTGGLDLVMQMRNDQDLEVSYQECIKIVKTLNNPTAKEQILIDEICGISNANKILNEKGYGLFDPDQEPQLSELTISKNILKEYFDIPADTLSKLFDRLELYLDAHKHLEYTNAAGEECLLGNDIHRVTYNQEVPFEDAMPFKELWCAFYEKEIKCYKVLINLYMVLIKGNLSVKHQGRLKQNEASLLGKDIIQCSLADNQYYRSDRNAYNNTYFTILKILLCIYEDRATSRELAKTAFRVISEEFSDSALWYENENKYSKDRIPFSDTGEMDYFKECLENWKSEEEFKEMFLTFYKADDVFRCNAKQNPELLYGRYHNQRFLDILDYIYAYGLAIIKLEDVYQAVFERAGLQLSLSSLSYLYRAYGNSPVRNQLNKYGIVDEISLKEHPIYRDGCHVYQNVVDKLLEVELKRGDTPTIFSSIVHNISYIYGLERLIEILKALGKDTLDRSSYYWRSDISKKSCLSHLLKICYPMKEDIAEKLSELMKGTGISEQRLIETAMYAPQWMDIIGKHLDIEGMKSGCYYFMAHMNEHFDDKKQAMIAKYTPLEPEKLYQGAFDLNWFKEAYALLGENNFNMLYESAKYISDGNKHARARKYADAALERVTLPELEAAIDDKRNKDLLMSYGLVPIRSKEDLLHRYQYLQGFLKESKQFGAQRRASESTAVEIAMENLAIAAGFSDVTRLTLMAESEMINTIVAYLDWKEIDGISVKLDVNDFGQISIAYKKNDKELKSPPAAMKNHDYIIKIKEIQKKLKEQYSRTKQMFEVAMESKTEFVVSELMSLKNNPVLVSMINNLVMLSEEESMTTLGFLTQDALSDYNGEETKVASNAKIRIAHTYDLYQNGCWHEYQQFFFEKENVEKQRKQPFKQVFRELYVKTEEEIDKKKSLMFAGNQIQPQKTAACLKSRRWIADYEEGLQKVYYKENIVANLYALADWFSPSDIEAPTLEWVEFSDRKTFEALTIRDIPNIIYSEVMRDVDLAVSVAHAGGVDPETSHSTIDMRKAIIGFNLPLFGLDNVILEGSHAIIKGKRAEYNIHLGSGIIHRIGGTQINVLPVHSQSRGKIFLPFIDEDPKTAEIISKIVLFARDEKIKDPYILDQL